MLNLAQALDLKVYLLSNYTLIFVVGMYSN
jgi:hypothetical protein